MSKILLTLAVLVFPCAAFSMTAPASIEDVVTSTFAGNRLDSGLDIRAILTPTPRKRFHCFMSIVSNHRVEKAQILDINNRRERLLLPYPLIFLRIKVDEVWAELVVDGDFGTVYSYTLNDYCAAGTNHDKSDTKAGSAPDTLSAEAVFKIVIPLLDYYNLPHEREKYEVALGSPNHSYGTKHSWNINLGFEQEGLPFRTAGLALSVTAFRGKITEVRYIPCIPPENEPAEEVGPMEAIENTRKWLKNHPLPQVRSLKPAHKSGENIKKIIVVPTRLYAFPPCKSYNPVSDYIKAYCVWEVPIRSAKKRNPSDNNKSSQHTLWVHIQRGEILGGSWGGTYEGNVIRPEQYNANTSRDGCQIRLWGYPRKAVEHGCRVQGAGVHKTTKSVRITALPNEEKGWTFRKWVSADGNTYSYNSDTHVCSRPDQNVDLCAIFKLSIDKTSGPASGFIPRTEKAVADILRELDGASTVYYALHGQWPSSLDQLTGHEPVLLQRECRDSAPGYEFDLKRVDWADERNNTFLPFVLTAKPSEPGVTGNKYFIRDRNGTIRFEEGKSPGPDSPNYALYDMYVQGKDALNEMRTRQGEGKEKTTRDERVAFNEKATDRVLRMIYVAQIDYQRSQNEYAGSIGQLTTGGSPCLPKDCPALAAAYRLKISGGGRDYAVTAEPVEPGVTGNEFFFMDKTGVIRFETGKPATAESPVYKSQPEEQSSDQ